MKLRFLLILLLLLVSTQVSPVQAQESEPASACSDAPSARLILDRESRVTPGASLRMRQSPGLTRNLVIEIPGGALLMVLEGPICRDSLNWWQVDWQGYSGWVAEGVAAEYYLEPLSSPVTRVELAVNQSTAQVKIANAQLNYRGTFGSVVEADETFPVGTDTPLVITPWQSLYPSPGYLRFRFLTASTRRTAYDEILIFPAKQYEAVNMDAQSALPFIRQMLESQPVGAGVGLATVHYLPIEFEQMQLTSAIKYLRFNGIKGVRFLTYFSRDAAPLRSERLRYFFMGLSDDGEWFISAKFWVDTPLLVQNNAADPNFPSPTNPNFTMLYAQYISDVSTKLNDASSSDFAPSLEALDALIESLVLD